MAVQKRKTYQCSWKTIENKRAESEQKIKLIYCSESKQACMASLV